MALVPTSFSGVGSSAKSLGLDPNDPATLDALGMGKTGAAGGGNASLQSALNDLYANGQDTMALQKAMGQLNRQIGFTTAIANSQEAMGQAAKGRGEAMKQQV